MDEKFFHLSLNKYFNNLGNVDKFNADFLENSVELRFEDFKIVFYLENYFEVNIYFLFGDELPKSVDIITLATFLNFSKKEIDVLKKNQISYDSIDKYIDNVIQVIKRILKEVSANPDVFIKSYEYKNQRDKEIYEYYIESKIKKELNDSWQGKDYRKFLELCANNADIVGSITKKDRLTLMRMRYLQRKTNQR